MMEDAQSAAELSARRGIFLLVARKLLFARHRTARAYDQGFRDSLGGWEPTYPRREELKWAYVEGLWAGTQVNATPISSDPLLWLPGNCRSRECFLVGIPHSHKGRGGKPITPHEFRREMRQRMGASK